MVCGLVEYFKWGFGLSSSFETGQVGVNRCHSLTHEYLRFKDPRCYLRVGHVTRLLGRGGPIRYRAT